MDDRDDAELEQALVAMAQVTASLMALESQPRPAMGSSLAEKAAYAAGQVRQYRADARELHSLVNQVLDHMVVSLRDERLSGAGTAPR